MKTSLFQSQSQSSASGERPTDPSVVQKKPTMRGRHFWVGLVLIVGLGATGYGLRSWQQANRAGVQRYQKGVEAMEAGSYSGAEQQWLQGIEEDPAYADNYESLGIMYEALLRHPEAAKYYQKAVSLSPDNGQLWKRLAKMALQIGDNDLALKASARTAALLIDDAEAQGEYGILAAGRQSRDAALKALSRAHELAPDKQRYLTALVAVLLDGDDVPGAERVLVPYLKRHPDDGEVNYLMAEVYNHKPRTPENVRLAIQYAEKARTKELANPRVYLTLGQLYLDSQQVQKALEVYEQARQFDPNNVAVISGLMQCYARLGDTAKHRATAALVKKIIARDDLKTRLRHALGFNQKDVKAALQLGEISEAEKNYERARSYFDHAAQSAPKDPQVVQARNDFYSRMRQRVQALEARKKPAKAAPQSSPAISATTTTASTTAASKNSVSAVSKSPVGKSVAGAD